MTDFYSVHDVGKVVSLSGAEGQVIGGVAMGIGYALFEELNMNHGQIVTISR